MALRNGKYGIYQGKEYKISGSHTTGYIIRSFGQEDIESGWRKIEWDNSYVNDILPEKIENLVDISTYATYRGNDFLIFAEENDRYLLEHVDTNSRHQR